MYGEVVRLADISGQDDYYEPSQKLPRILCSLYLLLLLIRGVHTHVLSVTYTCRFEKCALPTLV